MTTIYRGSIGVRFVIDTKINLSTASKVYIIVKKPSSKVVQWESTISDATNGIFYYDILAGDLDEEGIHVLQSYVKMTDGDELYGDAVKFHVRNKFDYDTVKWVA